MRRGDHWSPIFCSSITTPQSTLSTAPLYGSLTFLSLRRGGTQCRSGGCYSTYFFCSPITTPQSTLSTAPLYGSLTCLSLMRGGTQCRCSGFVVALFINLLHLCRLCYPSFFVCDRRRNPNLTLFLSSLYCFQFRHFRLLHRLRKPYTFHLF